MSSNGSQKGGSRTPLVIGLLLIVTLGIVGLAMMAGGKDSKAPAAKGVLTTTAPGAPVLVGDLQQSLAAYQGKVVILDLWATWCGPCRMEIPGFIKLQNKYRDQGLEIIGVSIDPMQPNGGGGAAAVAPFVQQAGINYTVWMVKDPSALSAYPPGQGIPTTYVLGRDGKTVKKYVGVRPESSFEADIKDLL